MASLPTWFGYFANKMDYSFQLVMKNFMAGKISEVGFAIGVWKNLQEKLTYLHSAKEGEMAPTLGEQGGTLLVRKIPAADTTRVLVGDVVLLKDPEKSDNYLVRRLAAIRGYEMVSNDVKDEPFVLEKDQCWVLADNEKLKPKTTASRSPTNIRGVDCYHDNLGHEAYDSRRFGPVLMSDIVGRAIYCMRTAVDHGPVQNSPYSMAWDSPILKVELDVEEMAKNHKA